MAGPASSETFQRAIELLYFAHRAVVAEPDRLLARRGLGRLHHRMLYLIARTPGIQVGQLCRVLQISKQAAHGPLATLEARGLVARTIDADNRRLRRLTLTRRGATMEARLFAGQRERIERAFRAAGPRAVAAWEQVMRLLA